MFVSVRDFNSGSDRSNAQKRNFGHVTSYPGRDISSPRPVFLGGIFIFLFKYVLKLKQHS
jgi:hypothetical protein